MKRPVASIAALRFAVQSLSFAALVWGASLGLGGKDHLHSRPVLPVLLGPDGAPARGALAEFQRFIIRGDSSLGMALLASVALAVFFGRLWCGWICPIGLIQDVITGIRSLFGMAKLQPSRIMQKAFTTISMALLLFVIVPSLLIANGIDISTFMPSGKGGLYSFLCPGERIVLLLQNHYKEAFMIDKKNMISGIFSVIALMGLAWLVIGSFAIRRAWCRVCPLGAIMAIGRLDALAGAALWKNPLRCTACGACGRVCPVDVKAVTHKAPPQPAHDWLAHSEENAALLDVTDKACVMCLKCVESCPEDGAICFRWLGITLLKSSFKRSRFVAGKIVGRARWMARFTSCPADQRQR